MQSTAQALSCYFFYPKSFLCLTVPSLNNHTLKITWTRAVKSFLHEVKNPHTAGWPEADPSQPGLCPLTLLYRKQVIAESLELASY